MSGFDLLVSLYSSENFFSMATLSFLPSTKNNLLFDFLRYFDFRLAEHSFNSALYALELTQGKGTINTQQ